MFISVWEMINLEIPVKDYVYCVWETIKYKNLIEKQAWGKRRTSKNVDKF